MTLQCDGVNNIGAIMCDLCELTINGKVMYYLDGYFYSLDTLPIIDLFDSVSI